MATQLQIRRGTNSQVAAFTGAEGEIVVNTTNDSVHVNDGSTAGGFEMARADLNNVTDTSLNAALTGNTVSALTITTLTLGATAITATGAELNLLDGVTATTAELNYVDGVTSAIQTQIDTKAPLASPTFTGTVTAAALTVDTTTLVVDATNNRVGIGTSSPITLDGNAAPGLTISSNGPFILLQDANNADKVRYMSNNTGELQFGIVGDDGVTGKDEHMRITSAGLVGIGTSPSSPLEVAGGSAYPTTKISRDGGSAGTQGYLTTGFSAIGYSGGTGADAYMVSEHGFGFAVNAGTSAMTITDGGLVGIGTSSPAYKLEVESSSDADLVQVQSTASANNTVLRLGISGNDAVISGSGGSSGNLAFKTYGTERMRIDSSGNVGIGKTPLGNNLSPTLEIVSGGTMFGYGDAMYLTGNLYYNGGWKAIATGAGSSMILDASGPKFYTNASASAGGAVTPTERMRIDSGGRVLINTSSGSYTHDKGLRVVSSEVGSHVLDAAVSIEGSGGDFYPINFVGPSNTGFGALAAFSPSTDYLQWQYRNSSGSTNIIRFDANGNVIVTGSLSKGSGSFRIDHPLPAKAETHHLVHSFIEGPQADNIYRGKIDLVDGTANVNIDTAAGMTEGTYALLNTNTQCFTSNESGWTAVKGSVSGNTLTITAQDNTCTDTISWMVVGERKDQHMIDTDWTDENGKVIVEPSKENN
jgi:hypothetical protein